MRRAFVIGLLAAFVVAGVAPAHAYIPERTPHRETVANAHATLALPEARTAFPALIIARGGVPLFSLNASIPMIPASMMKLLTTTTALVRFGPDHRFATRAMVSGSTLFLVGGGDPTLTTAAYRRLRFFPKPTDKFKVPAFASGSPTIEDLAARIARAGVHSVATIVCDGSWFDGVRTARGWRDTYLRTPSPETGLLGSALTLNEGFADPKQRTIFPDPAVAAGEALAAALGAHGVRVLAHPRAGRAPANAREIARVESPPLSEIVSFTNHYSINVDAEFLLKNLGAAFGGAGATVAGTRVVRALLTQIGVPIDGLSMADGSGLSIDDRIAPRTLATLLWKIVSTRGAPWDAMRASLPIAGGPGTLDRRMTRGAVAGNLRAKTGSIDHVRGMAGWVTGTDGVPIVFVAMFNRAPYITPLARPLDLLGSLLAGYPHT